MKPRIRVKLGWSGWFVVNESGHTITILEDYYDMHYDRLPKYGVNLGLPPVDCRIINPNLLSSTFKTP
jgi:hypothetical protein